MIVYFVFSPGVLCHLVHPRMNDYTRLLLISGCKDFVKKLAHIKQCYNDTGLKTIFHSDTVFDMLNANTTNTTDTKLCK